MEEDPEDDGPQKKVKEWLTSFAYLTKKQISMKLPENHTFLFSLFGNQMAESNLKWKIELFQID